MGKLSKKTILTVCHDAGGAEVVSSFVKKNQKNYHFFCIAEGPAKQIFCRKKLESLIIEFEGKHHISQIFDRIGKIDLVLTGTSWATTLELDFIREAKSQKTKTAAYLDHWANYQERFGYPKANWQTNLPDEIWVGDENAFELAKKKFADWPMRFVPNAFFEEIRQIWRKARKPPKSAEKVILFASEPIDAMKNKSKPGIEIAILEKLLKFLIINFAETKIIIRLHPSENINKYDNIVKKYGKVLKISVQSAKENMHESLTQASAVIGMKSMLLFIAALGGKNVASFLPEKNQHCPLPEARIVKIKKLKQLKKWLKKLNFK
jgi:hypothetical protein